MTIRHELGQMCNVNSVKGKVERERRVSHDTLRVDGQRPVGV